MQFKSFVLNDSVWVEMNQVYRKLPFITPDNRSQYIAAGKAIEKQDSLEVYLVKVTNVLDKNQVSPYEYIKPTLEQVILNKRKLELIKKLKKTLLMMPLKMRSMKSIIKNACLIFGFAAFLMP